MQLQSCHVSHTPVNTTAQEEAKSINQNILNISWCLSHAVLNSEDWARTSVQLALLLSAQNDKALCTAFCRTSSKLCWFFLWHFKKIPKLLQFFMVILGKGQQREVAALVKDWRQLKWKVTTNFKLELQVFLLSTVSYALQRGWQIAALFSLGSVKLLRVALY